MLSTRRGMLPRPQASMKRRSWCAKEEPRSDTTTSFPTCAASRSCAKPDARSCSTRRIRCSFQEGRGSGGQREFVPVLARAAVAPGVSGLFMETHPDPANAKSDGPNAWPLDRMESLLTTLVDLDRTVKERGFEEATL